MDLQRMIDAMCEADRRTRGNYHVTLGKLIEILGGVDASTPVRFSDSEYGPGNPHSYRGYYSDLAFEDVSDVTAQALLADCHDALGQTFEGYKGGDFTMGKDTPLWNAPYGCSGKAVVGADMEGGTFVLTVKEID
jgi:hypothetical protein